MENPIKKETQTFSLLNYSIEIEENSVLLNETKDN
jgi:hypothetical protein